MSFKNVPQFVTATSKENLVQRMIDQNIKDSIEHNYFSIQQDKQFWVAWYYDKATKTEDMPSIKKTKKKE